MRAQTGGRASARLLARRQPDFWHVGADLVLEVSGPRIPCPTTLAARRAVTQISPIRRLPSLSVLS
ncbi:hypothetical protein GCM10023214_30630 [Amycolatopsis dongchuanensis]|uniref:Uncharacterized protein n=1 Tax=Amycolatopsis dongchuanensis TaxID=1070866 RepID=A0ABP9QJR7_9PSEU